MNNKKERNLKMTDKENFKNKLISCNTLSYYLIAIHYGLHGISELAINFFLKDELKVQPAIMTQVISFVMIPWMLKPLLGLLTDLLPIFGYRRKFYLFFCGILVTICWLIMSSGVSKLSEVIILLLLINTGVSFSTVIGEAIVVELSQMDKNISDEEKDDKAKDNVSLYMLFKYTGVLASSFLKGGLVEIMSIRSVFIIAAFIPSMLIISSFILIDKKIVNEPDSINSHDIYCSNYISNSSEVETIKPPNSDKLITEFLQFLCQKHVLVPISFILFILSLPAYDGPYFYFLTNELKFSPTTLGKIYFVATLATFLSILLYKLYFKHVSFKTMITFGTLLSIFITFMANLVVMRVNVEIGIDDLWLVMFSNSLIFMLGELMLMPMLALAAKLCPKNLEGTVYSMFMSSIQLGNILAGLSGSILTEHLGITSTNFDNLSTLIWISNLLNLFPLFLLLFISNDYFEGKKEEEINKDKKLNKYNDISTSSNDNPITYKIIKEEEKIGLLSNESRHIV